MDPQTNPRTAEPQASGGASTSTSPASQIGKLLLVVVAGAVIFFAGYGVKYYFLRDSDGEETEASSAPAEPGQYVFEAPGMLASFSGKVAIKEDPFTTIPTSVGETVAKGNFAIAEPNGKAVFITTEGPVTVGHEGGRLNTAALEASPGLKDFWKKSLPFHLEKQQKFVDLANSRALATVPVQIAIDYPVGRIFEGRPNIGWRDKEDSFPYRIRLLKGDTAVWDRQIQFPFEGGEKMTLFPKEQDPLEEEVSYRLEVTSSDGRTASVELKMVSKAEASKVRDPLQKVANSLGDIAPYHMIAGYYYWQLGYFHQANIHFGALGKLLPDQRFGLESQVVLQHELGNLSFARSLMKRLESMAAPQKITVKPVSSMTEEEKQKLAEQAEAARRAAEQEAKSKEPAGAPKGDGAAPPSGRSEPK